MNANNAQVATADDPACPQHDVGAGGAHPYLSIGNRSSTKQLAPQYAFPDHCCRAATRANLVGTTTGQVVRAICKAASLCAYCARVARHKFRRAAGAAEPTALLTLTAVGATWPSIQRRMNRFNENLREAGYAQQMVWKVECNTDVVSAQPPTSGPAHKRWLEERGTHHGHHVHALLHGTYPTSETDLSVHAQRVGFGYHVNLRVPLASAEAAAAYLWGPKKYFEVHPLNHAHHMAMNGNRIGHNTAEYWRYEGQVMPRAEVLKRLNVGAQVWLPTDLG